MKTIALYLLALVVISAGASEFDTLSGKLPAKITNPGHPYLIVGDVIISPGDRVDIDPGVVFLFKNFTGMQVYGSLICHGDIQSPIVFTSENDQQFNPSSQMEAAQYDWNGITISKDAVGSVFENCIVMYGLFGINCQTPYVDLKNCTFFRNGKFDVAIDGKEKKTGSETFTYLMPRVEMPKSAISSAPAPKPQPLRITTRIVSIALAAGGAAYGAYKTTPFKESQSSLQKIAENTPENRKAYSPEDFDSAVKKRNTEALHMSAGFGAALLGILGFTLTFAF